MMREVVWAGGEAGGRGDGRRDIPEISVPSSQFCCERKTVLQIKVYQIKKFYYYF